MRKLSLLLVLCLMLCCFAACKDDKQTEPTPTAPPSSQTTTQAPEGDTTKPTEVESKVPETPQDKWTERY